MREEVLYVRVSLEPRDQSLNEVLDGDCRGDRGDAVREDLDDRWGR